MKPISIGNVDFKKKIEEGFYYVDKTKFIHEIIENFDGVKLFLRPRRFGKTTNMFMLKEYFDITKKEENKDLFKGLYIDSVEGYKEKYQGQYPVIFISLKEAKKETWEATYDKIKDAIKNMYEENKSLLEVLENYQQEEYYSILKGIATQNDYENSLKKLSEYLYRYYKQKVVILIDEYDAPLNQAHIKGFEDQAISFIRSFMGAALKDNLYLQCGVVTGVLQIGQQSIFSDLNNLKPYTVLTNQASEYFGFTKKEVVQMLKEYNLEDKIEEVIKWYDGYNFNGSEIFNPWSILNYVDSKGRVGVYWVNTGNTNLLDVAKIDETEELVETVSKLMRCETVTIEAKEKAVYEQMENSIEAFLSLLLFTGYLTIKRQYLNERNKNEVELKIPNTEIRTVIQDMEYKWFPIFNDRKYVLNVCKAIVEQDDENLKENLELAIINTPNRFNGSEAYYSGFFASMMLRMPKEYIGYQEMDSGKGYADYIIFNNNVGYIFEFKVCKKEEEMENMCNTAMKQVYEKQYSTKLEEKGIKEIYVYAIVICKKELLIRKLKLEEI